MTAMQHLLIEIPFILIAALAGVSIIRNVRKLQTPVMIPPIDYIIGGDYREARAAALRLPTSPLMIRYVWHPAELFGIAGNGRKLYVADRCRRHPHYVECLAIARANGFDIVHVQPQKKFEPKIVRTSQQREHVEPPRPWPRTDYPVKDA